MQNKYIKNIYIKTIYLLQMLLLESLYSNLFCNFREYFLLCKCLYFLVQTAVRWLFFLACESLYFFLFPHKNLTMVEQDFLKPFEMHKEMIFLSVLSLLLFVGTWRWWGVGSVRRACGLGMDVWRPQECTGAWRSSADVAMQWEGAAALNMC